MKKTALFVLVWLFAFSLSLDARGTDEGLQGEITGSFFSSLDGEVRDILEENGIDSLDSSSLFSKGTESIKSFFSTTLSQKLKDSAQWFFLILCILMLMSLVLSAYDFSGSQESFSLFVNAVICILTVEKISSFAGCTISAVELGGSLMVAFIPVFTLLVSLSGNPAGGLACNSMMMGFCQVISAFVSKGFLGIIGGYFALSVSFSFNPAINLNRFVNSVNRGVSVLLGFFASMFTGLLSVRSILTHSADSLSQRGVRFLLGSLVPVIGSSLSEAYSALLSSINLMKGSLGVVGIFGLLLINIPALCEGVIYYIMMSLLSFFAEIMGLYRASEALRSLACCVKILLLVCLFQLFVLIISVGIMLTAASAVR